MRDCRLEGMQVRAGQTRLAVPPAGKGTFAEAILPDGKAEALSLFHAVDGTLHISVDTPATRAEHDAHSGVVPGDNGNGPNPCLSGAYAYLDPVMPFARTTKDWYYNTHSQPTYATTLQWQDALGRAHNKLTTGYNDCGLSGRPNAHARYRGGNSRPLNMNNTMNPVEPTCNTGDRYSIVGWGYTGYALAVACTWWDDGRTILESDVKFDVRFSWWIGQPTCSTGTNPQYNFEAVAVREVGHKFGLGHVSEVTDPLMTMSPEIAPCEHAVASLGRGDFEGLMSLYGPYYP